MAHLRLALLVLSIAAGGCGSDTKSLEDVSPDDQVTLSSLEHLFGTWGYASADWIAANDRNVADATGFLRDSAPHLRVLDRTTRRIERDLAALEDDEIRSRLEPLLEAQNRVLRAMHRVTDATRARSEPKLRRSLRALNRAIPELEEAGKTAAAAFD